MGEIILLGLMDKLKIKECFSDASPETRDSPRWNAKKKKNLGNILNSSWNFTHPSRLNSNIISAGRSFRT